MVSCIYLVVACLIGQIGIAFLLVLLVNAKTTRLKSIHRTFGFFPSTISAVCIFSKHIIKGMVAGAVKG